MSTSAFPAASTISDTKPEPYANLAFLILAIDSMTMSLSIKRGTPLAVLA